MDRTRTLLSLALTCAVFAFIGCSDDTTEAKKDSKATPVDGGGAEGGTPAACKAGECWEYVVDKTIMPTDQASADKYAVSYKGKLANNLATVLIALGPVMKDVDIQASLSESTCEGANLVLLRMVAKALTSGSGKLTMWVGEDTKCCTTAPCYDKTTKACGTAAKQKCFSGGGAFSSDTSSKGMAFDGKITSGKIEMGPASGKLVIPTETANINIPLEGVKITGKITGDKITDGVLNGGIPVDQIKTIYGPLAKILNAELKNATPATAKMMKDLLDTDKDGTITEKELTNNTLLSAAFSADIKVKDKSGKEVDAVSLGVGFTAVKAKLAIQ